MTAQRGVRGVAGAAGAVAALLAGVSGVAAGGSFIGGLTTVSTIGTTVPANGDVNPYGIVVVQRDAGRLHKGDVLVSNFNDAKNLQGTGTTIVELNPGTGALTVFAHIDRDDVRDCPGGVGLTTALGILQGQWVIVGSLPTRDGTAATAQAGCLIILNRWGHVVETLDGNGINGPWDLTTTDRGDDSYVFVSNVLNGTKAANGAVVNRGTVERLVLDTRDVSV
ncbi:MAG: hypothetical protein JOY68_05680, partial [Candidatus Dormibacteraeota bacterium]|nr:hypothetical protein [Candidatus Dormibacteraeota bacterium]